MKVLASLVAALIGAGVAYVLFDGNDSRASSAETDDAVAEFASGAGEEYVSTDGRFRATFPDSPTLDSDRNPDTGVEVNYVSSEVADTFVGVSWSDYPDGEILLDGVPQGAADAVDGTVTESHHEDWWGRDTVVYSIDFDQEGGASASARSFAEGTRVYVLTAVARDDDDAERLLDRLFESFALTGAQP